MTEQLEVTGMTGPATIGMDAPLLADLEAGWDDGLTDEQRDALLLARQAQEADVAITAAINSLEHLAFAPMIPTTLGYHLALCGYREVAPRRSLTKLRTPQVLAAVQQLVGDMTHPQDARGATVDLNYAPAAVEAVALHLALLGYRMLTGCRYIKKRDTSGPGCYENACIWVPIDSPDDPRDELLPTHLHDDTSLPADVRALAARRDDRLAEAPPVWQTGGPRITYLTEERPTDE